MMKPYYSCAYGELFKGDCLEVMPLLGQKADLVLTDPPFGTSACSWDSQIPLTPLWEELKKLSKINTAIILFGSEPFSSGLRCSNLRMYKYDWKWEKDRGANFLNFKYQPSKNYEDIMVFSQGATSYTKTGINCNYFPQMVDGKPYSQKQGRGGDAIVREGSRTGKEIFTENKGERYPNAIQKFSSQKGLHPTQKPVALLEYLIKTYSLPQQLVLDFTAGSSSTAIACINTNRRFIMIEKEEKYCEISAKRIEEHINKMWSDL